MKRYLRFRRATNMKWYGGYENGYLRRVGFEPRVETRRWSRSARTWAARCACEGRSSASGRGASRAGRKLTQVRRQSEAGGVSESGSGFVPRGR